MVIFNTIKEIKVFLDKQRGNNKTIGFVPTMGALHFGHISLLRTAIENNDITVVSIFVNPTQFNNSNDFEKYPRIIEKDIALLEKENCDVVFAPTEKEMYPEKDTRIFNFGLLDNVLEGKFRPGHFNGVAQIVSKLFDIVNPDNAYFGEKDFQQLAVIKNMVKQLNLNVNIVPCQTVRESDHLAMSSRNMLLTPEQRNVVPVISKALFHARDNAKKYSVNEIKKMVIDTINAEPLLIVEYFEIVNALTFETVTSWDDAEEIVGCIAVHVGKIRLIDNVRFIF